MAAAETAHQRQRKVAEELSTADYIKHFTEDHEHHHDARADLQRLTEDPVCVEIKICGEPVDRPTLAVEVTREKIGE